MAGLPPEPYGVTLDRLEMRIAVLQQHGQLAAALQRHQIPGTRAQVENTGDGPGDCLVFGWRSRRQGLEVDLFRPDRDRLSRAGEPFRERTVDQIGDSHESRDEGRARALVEFGRGR